MIFSFPFTFVFSTRRMCEKLSGCIIDCKACGGQEQSETSTGCEALGRESGLCRRYRRGLLAAPRYRTQLNTKSRKEALPGLQRRAAGRMKGASNCD